MVVIVWSYVGKKIKLDFCWSKTQNLLDGLHMDFMQSDIRCRFSCQIYCRFRRFSGIFLFWYMISNKRWMHFHCHCGNVFNKGCGHGWEPKLIIKKYSNCQDRKCDNCLWKSFINFWWVWIKILLHLTVRFHLNFHNDPNNHGISRKYTALADNKRKTRMTIFS